MRLVPGAEAGAVAPAGGRRQDADLGGAETGGPPLGPRPEPCRGQEIPSSGLWRRWRERRSLVR
jgi:hypothetical protein